MSLRIPKVEFSLPNKAYENKKDVFTAEVNPQIGSPAMPLAADTLVTGLTQKMAAKKLGIDSLYSYQRLEHRANPTLKTIMRVKHAFPEFPVENVL